MKRILLVDDDASALQSARRMLRSACREWDVQLAENAQQALDLMADGDAFDLVVSELRLPGMDGVQFLGIVRDRFPLTARFALSGRADSESLLKVAAVSQQFVSKPCDPRFLASLVARTLAIRDHLHSPEMRKMLLSIGSLPSVPALYKAILDEIQSSDPSVRKVGEIISRDVAMSAKVLQIVNSAYVGLGHEVRDPVHAATLLGLEHLKNIALAVGLFSPAGGLKGTKYFDLDHLWKHSLSVADFAKRIAESEVKDRRLIDFSFTAGLLHDVGMIILATRRADLLDEAMYRSRTEHIPLFEAERYLLGVTHAQVGACLLELWGLPDAVVEAIAYHDAPSARPRVDVMANADHMVGGYAVTDPAARFSALAAVHVANHFSEVQTPVDGEDEAGLDTAYLDETGYTVHLEQWWDLCFKENN